MKSLGNFLQSKKLQKLVNKISQSIITSFFLFSVPKQSLQEKVSEYSSSFSIHGLSRTIHTDSMVERIFWIFALLIALCIAFFMVRSLLQKFFTKDVYVETKTVITTENTCLLYTSPSPRDGLLSRMPSSA